MSARYRAIAYKSNVDETLFGDSRSSGRLGSGSKKLVTGPILAASGSAVISADELWRIKNDSVIKSEAEIIADRERALAIKEEREKLSKDRKVKMRELEKKAVLMAKKSDFEIADISRKETILKLAAEQVDQNSDVVKLMSSMSQRAIAFTIREKQLGERHRLEQNEKDLEKKMDILIEIDRLKDIQHRDSVEQAKVLKRQEDRQVITQQIKERERTRMLDIESREQENIAMRNLMEKYKEEDATAAEKRTLIIEKSKKEVLKENAKAILRKQEMKEAEKRDIENILIYQQKMDAKLAKREEEEAAIELAKKERQMKLLAQQEKAQNNAGKLDELRARRAAEEKERTTRQKEKTESARKKTEMAELLDARAKQAMDKKARLRMEEKYEEEEILNGQVFMRRMEQREQDEARAKDEKSRDFKEKLMLQIETVQKNREIAKGRTGDGPNVREELIREEAKLNVIRNKMVTDLISQGVDPKYLSELKNVNIGKMLKR